MVISWLYLFKLCRCWLILTIPGFDLNSNQFLIDWYSYITWICVRFLFFAHFMNIVEKTQKKTQNKLTVRTVQPAHKFTFFASHEAPQLCLFMFSSLRLNEGVTVAIIFFRTDCLSDWLTDCLSVVLVIEKV